MLRRIGTGIVVLLALAFVGPAAWAGKLGKEFRVNSEKANSQANPSVAALTDGRFVVVWDSVVQDGSQEGVYGQRYKANGEPDGKEFRVNSYTADGQFGATVTGLGDGGFVVAWTSDAQDGSGYGVYGQRYGADGKRAGKEFRINSTTPSDQLNPSIAGLAKGGFVVTWTAYDGLDGNGDGVFGRLFGALGKPKGKEFKVNTTTDKDQFSSSVAGLANGGFVVAWESEDQDGSLDGVFAQRYDEDGKPVGGEFPVNTYTNNLQGTPSVAGLKAGGFVITWSSYGQDGPGQGVFAQRFGAKGAPAGGEFQVNTHTEDYQSTSAIAGLSKGGFIIAWKSYGQDGSGDGVYGQRFGAKGAPDGNEFRANNHKAGDQYFASVAGLSNGDYVVVWNSYGQDGSQLGIYGQRYHP